MARKNIDEQILKLEKEIITCEKIILSKQTQLKDNKQKIIILKKEKQKALADKLAKEFIDSGIENESVADEILNVIKAQIEIIKNKNQNEGNS